MLVKPICLNGRVNPGKQQVDYPTQDSQSVSFNLKIILIFKNHKQLLEWASFYNGIAHGLAVLGYGFMTKKRINKNPPKKGHRKKQSRLLNSVTASKCLQNFYFLRFLIDPCTNAFIFK